MGKKGEKFQRNKKKKKSEKDCHRETPLLSFPPYDVSVFLEILFPRVGISSFEFHHIFRFLFIFCWMMLPSFRSFCVVIICFTWNPLITDVVRLDFWVSSYVF